MYVFALHLRSFRSFEDLWLFPKEDVNVLVGPNNCGKTTVLRALALLLDPAVNPRQPGLLLSFTNPLMEKLFLMESTWSNSARPIS